MSQWKISLNIVGKAPQKLLRQYVNTLYVSDAQIIQLQEGKITCWTLGLGGRGTNILPFRCVSNNVLIYFAWKHNKDLYFGRMIYRQAVNFTTQKRSVFPFLENQLPFNNKLLRNTCYLVYWPPCNNHQAPPSGPSCKLVAAASCKPGKWKILSRSVQVLSSGASLNQGSDVFLGYRGWWRKMLSFPATGAT